MTRNRRSATAELDAKLERWLISQIQAAQEDLSRAPRHSQEAARRRYDCALECWADFVAVRTQPTAAP
jgi:hypothetical protein